MLRNLTISRLVLGESFSSKSRRDGTLLTVGFNLRIGNTLYALQSPAGTIQILSQPSTSRDRVVSSLRDLNDGLFCMFRRLKPTVNRVPSLRDLPFDYGQVA